MRRSAKRCSQRALTCEISTLVSRAALGGSLRAGSGRGQRRARAAGAKLRASSSIRAKCPRRAIAWRSIRARSSSWPPSRLGDGTKLAVAPDTTGRRRARARVRARAFRPVALLPFFYQLHELTPAMLARFTQVDYDRELALVAAERIPTGRRRSSAWRAMQPIRIAKAPSSCRRRRRRRGTAPWRSALPDGTAHGRSEAKRPHAASEGAVLRANRNMRCVLPRRSCVQGARRSRGPGAGRGRARASSPLPQYAIGGEWIDDAPTP